MNGVYVEISRRFSFPSSNKVPNVEISFTARLRILFIKLGLDYSAETRTEARIPSMALGMLHRIFFITLCDLWLKFVDTEPNIIFASYCSIIDAKAFP